MTLPKTPRIKGGRRWFIRVPLALVAVIAAYALLTGLVLPWLLRGTAERRLQGYTGAPVQIGKISFHPFALRLGLHDVAISDLSNRTCLAMARLVVDVQCASIWRGELALREIVLDSPKVDLHREPDGNLNMLKVAQRVQSQFSAKQADPADTNLFPVSITRLLLTNGIVSFDDQAVSGGVKAQLSSIEASARDISTRSEAAGSLEFSAQGDGGELLRATGTLVVQPLRFEGTLSASGVSLPRLQPYTAAMPLVTTSGVVRVELPVRVSEAQPQLDVRCVDGRVVVTNLAVIERTNGLPLLRAGSIEVAGIDVSMAERMAAVNAIRAQSGRLEVRRVPSGEKQEPGGTIEPEAIEAMIRDLTDWRFSLKEFGLSEFEVGLTDATLDPQVNLEIAPVTLSLRDVANITNAPPIHLELTAGAVGGEIQLTATATTSPVNARGKLTLTSLDLEPVSPYLSQFAHLRLSQGTVSAGITAGYGRDTEDAALVHAAGSLVISNLAAVDMGMATDFIRWDTVELNDFKAGMQPNRVELGELVVRGVQTSLIIHDNGQINVLRLLQQTEDLGRRSETSETEEEASPSRSDDAPVSAESPAVATASGNEPPAVETTWPINVGAVRIEKLSLFAADGFYGAGFETTVESIDGEIRNVSWPPQGPAEINLQGRLNALSGFSIEGMVHPKREALDADVHLTTSEAQLAQFTPYSVRFAGYPITGGQLTADVRYKVNAGQLEAENDLLIEQFTLGAKTNSPDAIDIPLKLGVALLKDREGRIHLNIPLTGNLADPQFKLGPIIWQAVRNVLVKAVTAPFALLGSIFGSKEDLEFVEFAAGSAELDSSATNRLNDLGRALIERPQLSLEIIPAFDPEADRRALAEARLVAVLREIRLEEYATQGTATTEVRLTPEDRARLIPIAFARRFGAVPSREAPAGDTSSSASPDSQAPVLSVEQMEGRLIETERIEPADLQKLAAERATAVQAFLTTAIGLEPERVSIASDDTDNPGKGESRVTFRLQ